MRRIGTSSGNLGLGKTRPHRRNEKPQSCYDREFEASENAGHHKLWYGFMCERR